MNKLIQDLGAGAFALTDLLEHQPIAGPPSLKGDINALVTLLNTVYGTGPFLPLAGGTMVGNILFSADNTRDIGASGATRPRTGYWGTSLVVPLLGSPAATALSLASAGTTRANFSTAGHLLFNTDNTNDIGAVGATRPRTGYFGTSVISPLFTGALTGAASLNVLKAGDTMTGALLFSPDNTVDIGASGATRPRSLYVAGTGIFGGMVTIGSGVLAQQLVVNAGGPALTSIDMFVIKAAQYPYIQFVNNNSGGAGSDGFKIGIEDASGVYIQQKENLPIYIGTNNSVHLVINNTLVAFGSAATSSFPAIKRNGAGIDFRLADDSAYASITTKNITQSVASLLSITSGTNQRAGNATLVGGTITVANTTVTANTIVVLTRKTSGGTIGTAITYTVSAATSFTINSDSVIDTSTFSYLLIEVP